MSQAEEPLLRRRVTVTGRVQGVYYRDSCRVEAERLGAAGWVCNLPDGSVVAIFEAPATVVEALVEWCRRGPARARVESLAVEDEMPRGTRGFVVLAS